MGGALKGSAGFIKLVTPGGATPAAVPIAGFIVCTGGDGAGALTAAADGGRNMPVTGACDGASDGDTGAWVVTLASGETPEVAVLVFGADNGA
jgi:hypothetical protein